MRPALVVIDFNARTARRYTPWPSPTRKPAFNVQEAMLQKPEGAPWQLGNKDGLALIEGFRRGELEPAPYEEAEAERA